MTSPFHYDTYVKSQIGIDSDYDNPNRNHLGSAVHTNYGAVHPPTHYKMSGRASLRNKIDELLGLCQNENKQVNGEFQEVKTAEHDILNLLKEQISIIPQSDGYLRSGVGNLPSQMGSPSYNEFAEHPAQNEADGYHSQGGFAGSSNPNDFLRSKVHELEQENRYLKNQTSQVRSEDQEIAYLKQEIQRLRTLLPQYEAEIARLRQTGTNNHRLIDLLEQCERIRQDTIALLRSPREQQGLSYQKSYLSELDELRNICRRAQEDNAQLKRISKDTNYTSLPRK